TPGGAADNTQVSAGSSSNASPRRLAGLESVILDNPQETKSFLVPEFRFEQSYDSNAQGIVPGSDERSILGGSLTLQHNSRRRHFELEYEGGATIDSNNSDLHSSFDRVA